MEVNLIKERKKSAPRDAYIHTLKTLYSNKIQCFRLLDKLLINDMFLTLYMYHNNFIS